MQHAINAPHEYREIYFSQFFDAFCGPDCAAAEGSFLIEDWHNFGADYTPTLDAWLANVEAAWPSLPAHYDAGFRRMWCYYLCVSAAAFRNQLWRIVLSPHCFDGGYVSVR